MSESSTPEAILSRAEIDAWCEKYGSTPWVHLALACLSNGDPGPLRVMAALRAEVERLTEADDRAECELERLLNAIGCVPLRWEGDLDVDTAIAYVNGLRGGYWHDEAMRQAARVTELTAENDRLQGTVLQLTAELAPLGVRVAELTEALRLERDNAAAHGRTGVVSRIDAVLGGTDTPRTLTDADVVEFHMTHDGAGGTDTP